MTEKRPEPFLDSPYRFLRTPEAARFLGLSNRTLEKHRTYGTGPRYLKLGGRVVYDLYDLYTWAEQGRKASTSDVTSEGILPARAEVAVAPAYRHRSGGRSGGDPS